MNNEHCFIGIKGDIGAGKDTVADYLAKRYRFKNFHFADALKDTCAAMFGVYRELFDDPIAKNKMISYWKMTPRQMAIVVGTDIIRDKFGEDHWVKRVHMEIVKKFFVEEQVERFTFSDVRFQNEVDYIITANDGLIITVKRDINPLKQMAEKAAGGVVHKTETQELIVPIQKHWLISNNRSKEDLYWEIDKFCSHYGIIQANPRS